MRTHTITRLIVGFLLALCLIPSATAFADTPNPASCPQGQPCKEKCDDATETQTSFCSPDQFSWVCCKSTKNLSQGEGGCPTTGDICQPTSQSPTCAPPNTDSGDKCLGGSGICCRPPAPKEAATTGGGSPTTLFDPLHGIGIIGALNRIILTFLGIVGSLALLVFVYAGVMYLTAGGSSDRVKHAVSTLKYAFIGLVLIMGAYVLTNFYFNALIAK